MIFNNENSNEQTFSIICNHSKQNDYTFTWNDGKVETFIAVSFDEAIVLSKTLTRLVAQRPITEPINLILAQDLF